MDYSPYQGRSRRSQGQTNGKLSVGLFLVSAIVGFLLFWGIKSFFFTQDGEISPVSFQADTSRAEILINEEGAQWADIGNSFMVSEGEIVRIKRGNTGALILEDNTKITLGLGAEARVGEIRKDDKGEISGDIFVTKPSALIDIVGEYGKTPLKIWVQDNIYIQASKGKILFQPGGIAVIEGENFLIHQVGKDKKIRSSKSLGIGQYLDLKSFTIKGSPESVKMHPLVKSFFPNATTKPNPEDSAPLKENTVPIPVITSPAQNGEIYQLTSGMQTITGTADPSTKTIWVYFTDNKGTTDEYPLKNFTKGNTEWKYMARPQYNTLSEGRNTYRIYAEDENGKRSDPAVLVIDYKKDSSAPQVFTNSKGKVVITAPNNGENTTQTKKTITLKGTAPSNASYITIVNKTLGSEYTLQKFTLGNKNWLYIAGPLDNKKYTYIVKALDAQKRILSSDTITITITSPKETPSPVPTTSNTPSPSPVSSPSPRSSPASSESSTFEASR